MISNSPREKEEHSNRLGSCASELKTTTRILFKEKLLITNPNEFPDDKCGICLEEFSEIVYLGKCGHAFHMKCINPWMTVQTLENLQIRNSLEQALCPICKQKLSYGEILDNAFSIVKRLIQYI